MANKRDEPVDGKLVSFVYVNTDRGVAAAFGPDDDVPRWAAEQMGAHCFEGGEHPLAGTEESGESADGPPPKAGRGSSTEAWVAYAEGNGVAVDDGLSRDEIIAAVERAGVPTE